MLKKPALASDSDEIYQKAENLCYTGELKPEDFPRGRSAESAGAAPAERTLTANMTGQITLTGSKFDLQFNRGSLKKISSSDKIIFDKLNSRTRLLTNTGLIEYRNESAFAFEGSNDYGLRTLQVPKKRKNNECRVITDFTFRRDSDEAFVTVTVDYPEFRNGIIIREASVFEFRILNNNPEGIAIFSDTLEELRIMPDTSIVRTIEGRSFNIKNGDRTLFLNFKQGGNSDSYSNLHSLSLKAASIRGRSFLFVNPGGSYTPVPGKFYSGIHEKICFYFDLKKKD